VRPEVVVPAAVAGAGLATIGYAWGIERKSFRLRRAEVPILPAGADPMTVLHLSDLHATPGQPWKVEWVRALAALSPDFVVDTGDNLASLHGVPVVLDALGPLLDRPGAICCPTTVPGCTASRCRGASCGTPSPPRAGWT
jgi:predicted MPP superfamily phosphohydrolase